MNLTIHIKPLSLNNCFRGRRFDTKAKKVYDRALQRALPFARVDADYFSVTFKFHMRRCFAGDLDNLCKVLLDNIVEKGIIGNDRSVVDIRLMKFPAKKDRIEVRIEAAEKPIVQDFVC